MLVRIEVAKPKIELRWINKIVLKKFSHQDRDDFVALAPLLEERSLLSEVAWLNNIDHYNEVQAGLCFHSNGL